MQGVMLKTVAIVTVIAGARGAVKPAPYKTPVAQPSLYSQGVLGKPTPPPPEPGLKEWVGGDFTAPEAKPSLYSQGITGKPAPKPPMKIGKGLIGEGALLGGPYKPPVAKPSLYSQGYTSGRGWTYVVGGPFEKPTPSQKTVDATGMPSNNKYDRQNVWVNLLWGGPYKKPSPGYGDPAVPAEAVPAEAAPEEPVLDEPVAGDVMSAPELAEETSGGILVNIFLKFRRALMLYPSLWMLIGFSLWMLFGFSRIGGSGVTLKTVFYSRLLRRDLPAEGHEPLMTA